MYKHQIYIFKQINETKPICVTSCIQQPITKQNKEGGEGEK